MIEKIKKNYLLIIFGASILIPLVMAITSLYLKTMPFWFDPARDFIAALDNQHKITLIGQPTGIPGLFYGPYWVWMLSFALFISRDPRVVQFLVLTLPYFIVFPLILYKMRNIFDLKIIVTLWTLFIFAFLRYTIFPWNPHLAPLLTLVAFYLLVTATIKKKRDFYLKTFIAGIAVGLIGNFHISFDIGLCIGVVLYFLTDFFDNRKILVLKQVLLRLLVFSFGFFLTFGPFFIFEARHGFFQTKTVLTTLLSPYAVVGLRGLSQPEIIHRLFQVPQELFMLPWSYAVGVSAAGIISLILLILKRKIKFTEVERKVLILSSFLIILIMTVYLTSKNPVWDYHFIGIEIIFLIVAGLIMKKINWIKKAVLVWSVIVAFLGIYNFLFTPRPSVLSYDTLGKKEYLVDLVKNDAKNSDYTVFAYNPGIYSYDYSYLFNWMAQKEVPYDPGQIKYGAKRVYLIIQKDKPAIVEDYINFHTPSSEYVTTRSWKIADETVVIRRELKR